MNELQTDDEIRAYGWEEYLIENGLLDSDQPTEAAHIRYVSHPAIQLLREEAHKQMRRERMFADLRKKYPREG